MMEKQVALTRLLPRIHALLFIVLFISALTLGPSMLNTDGDLPRHLLMGKIVLAAGIVPEQELFSYVYENQPYTPHEWLAGVVYYLAYLALDLSGVVLLASTLIAGTFAIVYWEAVRLGARYFLMFLLVVLGALVTSIHWVTRPHLFSMLFLAVWLVLTERIRRGKPVNIWFFPILMLFWANMHAEFIAGFLVLLAYFAGCTWQYFLARSVTSLNTAGRFLKVSLLAFLASMVNPAGLRAWEIVAGYINNRYLLSRITETRPPDFTQPEYWPLLSLLLIAATLLITKRRSFAPAHFFLAAGFGAMSLLAARNAHLAGVVFPFLLSNGLVDAGSLRLFDRIDVSFKQLDNQARGSILPILVTIGISILLLLGPAGNTNRFERSVFPVEAVRWLEDHPQGGRMFNAFDWGGYLLFHLWPEHKVFIESQTDVTGDVTREYESVVTMQEDWQQIFEQYGISWAIIPPEWDLAQELSDQGWQPVYEDQTSVILVKP